MGLPDLERDTNGEKYEATLLGFVDDVEAGPRLDAIEKHVPLRAARAQGVAEEIIAKTRDVLR